MLVNSGALKFLVGVLVPLNLVGAHRRLFSLVKRILVVVFVKRILGAASQDVPCE